MSGTSAHAVSQFVYLVRSVPPADGYCHGPNAGGLTAWVQTFYQCMLHAVLRQYTRYGS
jgi:hypothetical protein